MVGLASGVETSGLRALGVELLRASSSGIWSCDFSSLGLVNNAFVLLLLTAKLMPGSIPVAIIGEGGGV